MMIEISSTSNDISTPGHGEARKCQTEKKENDQEKQEKQEISEFIMAEIEPNNK